MVNTKAQVTIQAAADHCLSLCQVGAAAPVSTPTQPSWISRALSYFVMLRKEAAELEGRGELMCMPVAITASTRASASSLHNTASGNSKVKDIHLRPLTKRQMHALVLSLVRRSSLASALPATLPDELMLLLQLTGGNPRMLSHTLCLTSGSTRAEDDVFLLGAPLQHFSSWQSLCADLCWAEMHMVWCMGSCYFTDVHNVLVTCVLVNSCVSSLLQRCTCAVQMHFLSS